MSKKPMISHHVASAKAGLRHVFVRDLELEALIGIYEHEKTDPQRMQTVLYVTAETIRRVATLCLPFIPDSADKLLDLLAVAPEGRAFALLSEEHALVADTALPPPAPVFPRYVEQNAEAS